MVALRLACSLGERSFAVVSEPVAGLQPIEVFASVEQLLFLCFSPAINYLWPSPWELLFHYLYLKEISRMCRFILFWTSQVLILRLSVIKKATHSLILAYSQFPIFLLIHCSCLQYLIVVSLLALLIAFKLHWVFILSIATLLIF